MQISMLGSLEVRTEGGASVDVPSTRLRGLLTALAREPGGVVPTMALIDWMGRAPARRCG